MNQEGAEKGEVYKVFFLGRHGQGYRRLSIYLMHSDDLTTTVLQIMLARQSTAPK